MLDNQKFYIILPGCDDTNRGDQALIWETVNIAKDAGFNGKYVILADSDKSIQTKSENIDNINLILPHPSTHFKKNKNINYGILLKIKWAFMSLIDCIKAVALLFLPFRMIAKKIGTPKLRESINAFENADAAFVKGGGFLHAYKGIISTYIIFFQLYHIILALSIGKSVYIMPNSYGPFNSPCSNWLINAVLKKCKIVTARESISKETLEQSTNLHVDLFPDLAFYLEPSKSFTEEQLKNFSEIPFHKKKCVALTVRPYRFPQSSNPIAEYNKYKSVLCDFIRYLSTEGYHPVLIEHTYSTNEHEQDMSCINDIVSTLGNSCQYSVYSDLSLTCRQLKYVYSCFDYIIGTRFHSVIFSLAAGVPAIAITYGGNKGKGIMKDIGLENLSINIENLDFSVLKEVFLYMIKNKEQINKTISEYLVKIKVERDILVNLLKDGNK